jgi:hypothetical protein
MTAAYLALLSGKGMDVEPEQIASQEVCGKVLVIFMLLGPIFKLAT